MGVDAVDILSPKTILPGHGLYFFNRGAGMAPRAEGNAPPLNPLKIDELAQYRWV
jgi:hypothetical protein